MLAAALTVRFTFADMLETGTAADGTPAHAAANVCVV